MAKKKMTLEGQPRKSNAGRKSVITDDVRRKIEEAAALDASVEEIAFYADISRDAYYDLLNRDKPFSDRIAALRQRPVLKARQTANEKMVESYQNAMDYLKRKRKAEFGDSSMLEVTLPRPIDDILQDLGVQEDQGAPEED